MINLHYRTHLLIVLVIFVNILKPCICTDLQADPLTSYLTDKNGRFIFYHGVNVVYKQFPFYPNRQKFNPMDSLVADDFKKMNDWGIRAIRLYVAWQGFEPKQNQYNYTYLQKIKQIVRQAKKYDISILIDAHQDLYSRKFCGEGLPDWIVKTSTFPAPLKVKLQYDINGIPTKQSCMKIQFFKYYETDDVLNFSHDFFSNKNGMADKFIKMWIAVVSYFKSQQNILGYDLINQPSGANFRKNPYDFFGPGANNNNFLLPFYKRLAKAIRQVDQSALLFFEPCVADYLGGFYQSPSGSTLAHKDILSYHTYCPFKNSHNQPTSQLKCKIVDEIYMNQRIKNIKKLKCGSSMTQFGSVPETDKGLEQAKRVLRLADKNWQSWFWWQYKYNSDSTCSTNPPWQQSLFYPNGTIQSKKVFALSYPYAYAVCGTPLTQQSLFNTYYLSFIPGTCGNSFTQIYINQKLYFPNGFTVNFKPQCKQCLMQNYRANYYKLIVPSAYKGRKLQLTVGGYI